MGITIKLLLVFIAVCLVEGFVIYILTKKQRKDRKRLKDQESRLINLNADNVRKNELLAKMNKVEEKNNSEKEKINNADNVDIAGMLNSKLSNDNKS